MNRLRSVSLGLMLLCTFSVTFCVPDLCLAQTGEKYALLVGVREYDKNELRSLPFSEADVEGLARLLRDAGYRPENVVVMTQSIGAKKPRFAPMAANIRKELELLLEGRAEGDSVVVALAGHGVQFRDDSESYFCPTDAKLTDKSTLISLGSLYKTLEGSKANLKLLLVDACRNDPQADNSRARSTVKLESATRPQPQQLPGGVAALFSCSAGERAFEHAELKHGVFFHFVIQGLGGDADFDHDKVVTLPELQQYAMKRVSDFVRAEYGVRQTPDLQGKTRGLFPLLKLDTHPADATPRTKLRVTGQSAASIQIVQKFIEMLEKQHYSQRKLNSDLAARWIENVLDSFDEQRRIFLQDDVDRLRSRASEIEAKARLGDVGFVWELFNLWVDRRVERRKWVDEWLAAEHDFTIQEDLPIKKSETWPRTPAEARDLWRKQVKLAIVYHRAKGYDPAEAAQQASRYMQNQFFGNLRSFDDDGLLESALSALGTTFDPNSKYLSAKSVNTFLVSARQRLVGIGAQLRLEDTGIVVLKVVAGGPAARDGRLKAGDRILAIGEKTGEMRSVLDLKLNDSVELIRGKVGTIVRLEVVPKGQQVSVIYELARGTLELQNARSTVFTEQRRGSDRPVKIGYISLTSLYTNFSLGQDKAQAGTSRSSASDVGHILEEFNGQNVDVAILDLRNNSGGPLTETNAVLGLFLDMSPCMINRGRDGKPTTYWSTANHRVWDRPLVVLTGRGTGSGAEIIAGTLQDYGRALLIGDSRTSGAGTVHSMWDIGEQLVSGNNPPRLGAAKIGTSVFFFPSGRTVADHGIAPDIVLPSFSDQESTAQKVSAAPTEPVKPLIYPLEQYVNQKLIDKLKRQAEERQKFSPEFQEFCDRVRKYERQKKMTTVPLDEARYLADFKSRIVPDSGDRSGDQVVVRDTYLNEILAMTLDFAPRGNWLDHFTAGMTALRQKSYAEAITKFTAAVAQDPDQPAAIFQRARARAGDKDWEKALEDLKLSGASRVSGFVTQDVDLKVGESVATHLKSGHRVVVDRTNGEWVWVQPVESLKGEGWVKKTMVAPILPETNKRK